MAIQSANIKIRTAWWLPLYLKAIVWTYAITGREPDWSKVAAASLKMWEDPARRAKRSEDTKARWADPVWKAKQAEKIKAGKAARLALVGKHFGSKPKTAKLAN